MQEFFYALALLACPVGMGLMMVMMMRKRDEPSSPTSDELTRLRVEVKQLRVAQRDPNSRLGASEPPER